MKFYFCGSIRGGRSDADLYARMIQFIKEYGPVLTEHVGDPTLTERGGDGGSTFIWQRDTAWLQETDMVIAECSTPSLGVGYELAYAEAQKKPCAVFCREDGCCLSAMIAGDPYFQVYLYKDEEELFYLLREVLDAL